MHAEREGLSNADVEERSKERSGTNLMKIEERKKHNSKKKKKDKKASIKSNLDIFDARHVRPPELPSLHPMDKTIMAKTRFNSKFYDYL